MTGGCAPTRVMVMETAAAVQAVVERVAVAVGENRHRMENDNVLHSIDKKRRLYNRSTSSCSRSALASGTRQPDPDRTARSSASALSASLCARRTFARR